MRSISLAAACAAAAAALAPPVHARSAEIDSLFRAERVTEADSLARRAFEAALETAAVDSTALARAHGSLAMVATRLSGAKLVEIEEPLRAGIGRIERWMGAETEAAAWAHLAVARLSEAHRDMAAAIAHGRRAVEIREQVLGPESEPVARALAALANVERAAGEIDAAHDDAARALAIYRRTLGEEHASTASAYASLAQMQVARGEYVAGRANAEASLRLREQLFGPESRETAHALFAVALAAGFQEDVERSLQAARRSREIYERELGPRAGPTLSALGLEGDARRALGDLAGARQILTRTLEMKIAALGHDHLNVASAMNNLANVLIELGHYEEGYSKLLESAAILRTLGGDDDPQLLDVYNNLAVAKSLMGDEEDALRHVQDGLALCDRLGDGLDADRAQIYATLASTVSDLGDPGGADSLMARALERVSASMGPDHPEVGDCWNLRAEIARRHGRIGSAIMHQERGLAILEAARGREHPSVLIEQSDLVDLLLAAGRREEAAERSSGLPERLEAQFGRVHPEVADAWWRRAIVEAAQGDVDAALQHALRAEEIRREHVALTVESLPERQAMEYATRPERGLDLALALAAGRPQTPSRVRDLWGAVASSRALVLDALARRGRSIASAGSDESAADTLRSELAAARRHLSRLLVDATATVGDVRAARTSLETAEREWARTHPGVASPSLELTAEQIEATRPLDRACVAYVRYSVGGVARTALPPEIARDGYIAIVLPRRGSDPALVPLGSASEIERLVDRWRAEVGRPPRNAPARSDAGAELRRRIWNPVQALLPEATRDLDLIPDGALHLVGFYALPGDALDRYLVDDEMVFHIATSERDLLNRDSETWRSDGSERLLAVGDVTFDSDPNAEPSSDGNPLERAIEGVRRAFALRGTLSDCEEFAEIRFEPLPETKREIDEIARSWERTSRYGTVERLVGPSATEAQVKQAAVGARVLHLATHGFVEGGSCEAAASLRGIGSVGNPDAHRTDGNRADDNRADEDRAEDTRTPDPSRTRPQDLLRLSGLALAGANNRAAAPLDREDGILTAEELSALDLSAAEWVVLSACDTGVGEVTTGEGVFGLRRAIRLAGARTGIASLWPVEDAATLEFMSALYRHRWALGKPTADAIRDAQRDVLHGLRDRGTSTHPFTWGAFTATGE